MKKLTIILIILLFVSPAWAVNLEVNVHKLSSEDALIKNHAGFQVDAGKSLFNGDAVYIYGSYDPGTMFGVGMDVVGIGGGYKFYVNRYLSLYGQAGYYFLQHDSDKMSREGPGYYLIDMYNGTHAPTWFQHYKVDIDGNFGAQIGAKASVTLCDVLKFIGLHSHCENVLLGVSVGYRWLAMDMMVYGWDTGGAPGVTGWQGGSKLETGGIETACFIRIDF